MEDTDAFNSRMTKLLMILAPKEGAHSTLLEGVNLMRVDRYSPPSPVLYEPSIVVVAQGRKKGYLGGQVYQYDAHNYLVLSVPLPFESETEATPMHPMLGVSIRTDLSILTELMVTMNRPSLSAQASMPQGICSTPLNHPLSGAIIRLLEHLMGAETARILGPQTVREIMYLVLCGEQGDALRAALKMPGHFTQISRILNHIHAEYTLPMDIKSLAEEAHMSLSVFHRSFKGITSTSPLQYIQTIRLHKARMLMVQAGMGAGEAAEQVGYESASQFSREFKRLFGKSPMQEVAHVRHMFVVK